MNGIIIVDKPKGYTSFDVVAKMRGICKTRKIGHGGTLDPMATGVLPVFIGAAAKAVDLQLRQDKTYEAAALFGLKTDTGDITGDILERKDVKVSLDMLLSVIPAFIGEIEQLPPMYSAIKVDGKPLYKYAREGIEIERKLRKINIHSIEKCDEISENCFGLTVHCSKGTYIRTLVEDIGASMGLPSTLCGLRRIQAGVFGINAAHTLEEIQAAANNGSLEELILPIDCVFDGLDSIILEDKSLSRIINGAAVYRVGRDVGRYKVYGQSGNFAGVAEVRQDGNLYSEKMFVSRAGE